LMSRARRPRTVGCLGALVGAALVTLAGGPVGAQQTPGTAELAFQNGDRIYAIGADGSARRLVTDSGSGRGAAFEPAWSPDGTRLAMAHTPAVSDDDERAQIQLVQADGSGRRNLTALARGVVDTSPRWSPGGHQLVFVRYSVRRGRYTSSIVIYDLSTGTERTVARERMGPRLNQLAEPDWSPDGAQIVYTRARLDRRFYFRPSLYVMAPDGTGRRVLARDAQSAAFSPDGTRIAFASVRDRNGTTCGSDECSYNGELYVMNASGANPRRLTHNRGNDASPDWSPDGGRIAFASDRSYPEGAGFELYSVQPDGGCLTWLTNGTPESFAPDWRPGAGGASDPATCGGTPRPPLIETDLSDVARIEGSRPLWLGRTFRGLLVTAVDRTRREVSFRYDDCAHYDPRACPARLYVSQASVCAPDSHLPFLTTNRERYSRRRGAFIVDFGREAGMDVYTGGLAIHLSTDVKRQQLLALRDLRPFGPDSPDSGRLAPPALPREFTRDVRRTVVAYRRLGSVPAVARLLDITPATVRRWLATADVLRKFGPFRTVRCEPSRRPH
jgi:dipeptidyl aminopeptidase/acylaminoacyl peptidase